MQHTSMGMEGPDYKGLTFRHHVVGDDGDDRYPEAPHGEEIISAHHPEHGEIGHISYSDMEHPEWTGFPPRAIHVNMLRVKADHRRRGVATQIMNHLEDRYRDVPIDHGSRTRMGEAWGQHMYGRASKPKAGDQYKQYNPETNKHEPFMFDADWTLNGKPWSIKTQKPLRRNVKKATVNVPHSRAELIAHAEGNQRLYAPAGTTGPALCASHAIQAETEHRTTLGDLGVSGEHERPAERDWQQVGQGQCGTCTRHQNEWLSRLPGQYNAPLDGPRMSPESRPRPGTTFRPSDTGRSPQERGHSVVDFHPKMFRGLDHRESVSNGSEVEAQQGYGPARREGNRAPHQVAPEGLEEGTEGAESSQASAREVSYHPAVKRDLKKLDPQIARAAVNTIQDLTEGKRHGTSHPLNGPLMGWYATGVRGFHSHRITYRSVPNGPIEIGHVGPHNYDDAVRRLGVQGPPEDLEHFHRSRETGGSKWPVHHTMVSRTGGEYVGELKYYTSPREKRILIDNLDVDETHRRRGIGSAMMDELQRRYPDASIDHGDRTDMGKQWWKGYTDGKSVRRGRTAGRMIDLYHRTTPEAAEQIYREHKMTSKENTQEAYFSTHREGEAATGYGEGVVHVRVPEHMAELDDEFPSGEQHYRVHVRDLRPEHFVKEARFTPTKRVFTHTCGLDHRLFEGEHLKTDVRKYIVSSVHDMWSGLHDWPSWSIIYFAGSEASEWTDTNLEGNNDFDVLIGVDYPAFRKANPQWAHQSSQAITDFLNAGFKAYNGPVMLTIDGSKYGPFDRTTYVNHDSYDISRIKPYAAYDVTHDRWAVKPPHLPHWSLSELPRAVQEVLRSASNYAHHVLSLPEPERTQQGAALFDSWHSDRSRAFGPNGEGWWDIANLREKWLDQEGVWAQIVDCKHRANEGLDAAPADWSNTPKFSAKLKTFDQLQPHEQHAVSLYHEQMKDEGFAHQDETPHEYHYDVRQEPKAEFLKRYMDADNEFKEAYGPDEFEAHHQETLANHPIPHYPSENRWPLIVRDDNPNYVDDGYHRMHSYIRDGATHIPTVRMFHRGKTGSIKMLRPSEIHAKPGRTDLDQPHMKKKMDDLFVSILNNGYIHQPGDEVTIGHGPEGDVVTNGNKRLKALERAGFDWPIPVKTSTIKTATDWHEFDTNHWYRAGHQAGAQGNYEQHDYIQGLLDKGHKLDPEDVDYMVGHAHGVERARENAAANHHIRKMFEEAPEYNSVEHQVNMLGHELRHEAMGAAGPDYEGLRFKYWKNYSSEHDEPHWLDGNDKYDRRSFFGVMAFHPDHPHSVGTLEFSPHDYGNGDREVTLHGLKVNPEHQRRGVGRALMNEVLRRYPDVPINHGIKTEQGEAFTRSTQGIESPKLDRPGHSSTYGEAPYAEHWTMNGQPYHKTARGPLEDPPEETLGHVHEATPEEFAHHFSKALEGNPYSYHLTHHNHRTITEGNMKPLLAHGGRVGVLIHDHGDGRREATGLFNRSGIKSAGSAMLQHAIDHEGVNYVEAFGPHLPKVYEKLGFRTSERYPFDRSLAHPNWDYQRFGEPDYHTMHLRRGKEAAVAIDIRSVDWDDPRQVAALRREVEAELLAEHGSEWYAAHRPFLDENWNALLHQFGVI